MKLKKILKKILLIDLIKAITGVKLYNRLKHTIRHYGLLPRKYNIKKEIDFGSESANHLFIEELSKSKLYLEYGSGASSFSAKKLNKNFYAIEGDIDFFRFIKKELGSDNVKLKSLGIVSDYSIPLNIEFHDNKNPLNKNLKKSIKAYCNSILEEFEEKNLSPDLVLVDGRYRVLTCLYLYKFFKKNKKKFKIIIDDYIHRAYGEILENFFHINKFERFGIATEIIENSTLEEKIEKSFYDYK